MEVFLVGGKPLLNSIKNTFEQHSVAGHALGAGDSDSREEKVPASMKLTCLPQEMDIK